MPEVARYTYDAASAISLGKRAQQEDTLAIDFSAGAGLGFVVLADGMGGHSAGDVASKIVVTEIFSELKMYTDNPADLENNIHNILQSAVTYANECVGLVARNRPNARGMGSTIVAPIVIDNRLYWISVGDSPLYLFRGSRLFRLNEEHSLARRMDRLVAKGQLDRDVADSHPERFSLTSVLIGQTIPEIDCRDKPIELRDGDIVIAASDGLQFITEGEIARAVHETRGLPSAAIGAKLLARIAALDDPDQDNVAFCVLKLHERSNCDLVGELDFPAAQNGRMAAAVPTAVLTKTRQRSTNSVDGSIRRATL